jgi:hypothetical protein
VSSVPSFETKRLPNHFPGSARDAYPFDAAPHRGMCHGSNSHLGNAAILAAILAASPVHPWPWILSPFVLGSGLHAPSCPLFRFSDPSSRGRGGAPIADGPGHRCRPFLSGPPLHPASRPRLPCRHRPAQPLPSALVPPPSPRPRSSGGLSLLGPPPPGRCRFACIASPAGPSAIPRRTGCARVRALHPPSDHTASSSPLPLLTLLLLLLLLLLLAAECR